MEQADSLAEQVRDINESKLRLHFEVHLCALKYAHHV